MKKIKLLEVHDINRMPMLLILSVLLALILCGAVSASKTDSNVNLTTVQVPFIENQGQTDHSVDYYADTYYGTVYLTKNGITHKVTIDNTTAIAIEEQFLDQNGKPVLIDAQGENQSQAKVNYLIGTNENDWKTDLETYNTVKLGELYPGIIVEVQAHGGNVEKLFNIQPGSDINKIQVQIQGADSLHLLDDGILAIKTDKGIINLSAPQAYQENHKINVAYKILSENSYGFIVGEYDHSKELVIDPTLQYCTYMGGSDDDCGLDISVDSAGNVYVVGYTFSSDFPTSIGAYKTKTTNQDGFICKLSPTGKLIYNTYLGGDKSEVIHDIKVDNMGNAYVTGTTTSTNFPTSSNAYQTVNHGMLDAFVCKLNSYGNGLIYSTYLGGSLSENGYGIIVDGAGNVYISGLTDSENLPITSNAFQKTKKGSSDVFITKLNSTGTGLIYSTYLGGSSSDFGEDIELDKSGNIFIAGITRSSDFPISSSAFQKTNKGDSDVFICKLNSTGTGLIYSTYLGGNDRDSEYGFALDNSGNTYITGVTCSSDFPTTSNAYQKTNNGKEDVFISKLNSTGTGLIYSTYLGGNETEYGLGIGIDHEGNAYIIGETNSTNFPTTSNAIQTNKSGENDVFTCIINPTADNLVYSTYLGGNSYDIGYGIALDTIGDVYITGNTKSTDFPTKNPIQTNNAGGFHDCFIAKISLQKPPTANYSSTPTNGTEPLTVHFTDLSTGSITGWAWDFDNNGTNDSTLKNPTWTYNKAGKYTVKLTVTGPGGSDSETKTDYITVKKSDKPDLLPTEITITNYTSNYSLVKVNVTNNGVKSSGNFDVTLYDNGTQIKQQQTYALGPGKKRTLSFICKLNSLTDHNLQVVVDKNNKVTESDETNNTLTKIINNRIDLQPTELNLTYISQSHYCIASVKVANNGSNITESFDVTLYDNNKQIEQKKINGLTSSTTTTVYFIWNPSVKINIHNIEIVVDKNNNIPETNENNNGINQQIDTNKLK